MQLYSAVHDDGVFFALGNEGDISALVNEFSGERKIDHVAIRSLPNRALIDEIIDALQMSAVGVSGFFNVIAQSEILSIKKGETETYTTNARAEDRLHGWQRHVGWYGFFRADYMGPEKSKAVADMAKRILPKLD